METWRKPLFLVCRQIKWYNMDIFPMRGEWMAKDCRWQNLSIKQLGGNRVPFVNLTGQTFGRLTVIRKVGSLWECQCTCGKVLKVATGSLKSGNTKSCGCLRRESLIKKNFRHGGSKTPEYQIWKSMIGRCHNPRNARYENYGGRGIVVCDKWRKDFRNFIKDMGQRPSPQYSIDRIDNDGNYEPNNCRWATVKEQANNKRSNVIITEDGKDYTISQICEKKGYPEKRIRSRIGKGMKPSSAVKKENMSHTMPVTIEGETKSVSEWARLNGISPQTAWRRISYLNWTPYDAVTIKENPRIHFATIDGVTKTVNEWCEKYGIAASTALSRIKNGWTPEKAVTVPTVKPKTLTYMGVSKTCRAWGEDYNISPATLWSRIKSGWSIHDALNTPVKNRNA